MFYQFYQNNSGGSWHEPAIIVIVEASTFDKANTIAEQNGVYFDGCSRGIDCDCCGDRWHRQLSNNKGEEVPSDYGRPINLNEDWKPAKDYHTNWGEEAGLPNYLIVYKDGTKKSIK